METYIGPEGCVDQLVPDISLFTPRQLNTDNWVQTMKDFGAKYAVLVVKVIKLINQYLFDSEYV